MPYNLIGHKRMRILMVSQHYPPRVSGYAIQCAETSRRLGERGHRVIVLAGSDGLDYRDKGSKVLKLLKVPPWTGYQPRTLKSVYRQIKRRNIFRYNKLIACAVAKAFQPDIVMVWQFEDIGIGLVQELQGLGIPIVYNVGDYLLCDSMTRMQKDLNPLWRLGRRWIYGVKPHELDTSNLIFSSEVLKSHYVARGFSNAQVKVIHNGIDSKYIVEHPGKVGAGRRLLYAGRIDQVKGVDVAIKALAILKSGEKDRFTLDIVGVGSAEYVGKLKELARRLNIGEFLRFIGPKDRGTLIGLYQHYDILLFPSVQPKGSG